MKINNRKISLLNNCKLEIEEIEKYNYECSMHMNAPFVQCICAAFVNMFVGMCAAYMHAHVT